MTMKRTLLTVIALGALSTGGVGCVGQDRSEVAEDDAALSREGAMVLRVSQNQLRLGRQALTRAELRDWSLTLSGGGLHNRRTGETIQFSLDQGTDTLRVKRGASNTLLHFRDMERTNAALARHAWHPQPDGGQLRRGAIQPKLWPVLLLVVVVVLLTPAVANPVPQPDDPDIIEASNEMHEEVLKIEVAIEEEDTP